MISTRELAIGIYGAWRLLHFDRAALQYFDSTIEGFWKSYSAALVALPTVIILRVLFAVANPDDFSEAGTSRAAMVFAIDYAYQWVLFPLFMFYLAEGIGRRRQYVTFIVAHNWSQVIQIAIILPAALLFLMSGDDGLGWGAAVLVAAHLVTWVYSWFIARTALDISGMAAALVVLTEIAIAIVISTVSQFLIVSA